MKHLLTKQTLYRVYTTIKPWVTVIIVVLVLRFTGLLSGLSFVAQSALIKSGVFAVDPEREPGVAKAFDYNFDVQDLEGKKLSMADLKGKVIFLNIWATWCGPCRAEMPSIQELYNKVDREKVAFVMLSIDTEENHNKIVRYVQEKNFSFPVYTPASAVPSQLRVSTIPTTFVVDREGKIALKNKGMADYSSDDFKSFLENL